MARWVVAWVHAWLTAPATLLLVDPTTGLRDALRYEEDGYLTRPDGKPLEISELTPINNFTGRAPREQAIMCHLFAQTFGALECGQKMAYRVSNGARDLAARLDILDQQQPGFDAVSRDYRAIRRRHYLERHQEAPIPDRRYTLCVEGPSPPLLAVPAARLHRDPTLGARATRPTFRYQIGEVDGILRPLGVGRRTLDAQEVDCYVRESVRGAGREEGEREKAREEVERPARISALHQEACDLDAEEHWTYMRFVVEGRVRYARTLYIRRLRATLTPGWIAPLIRQCWPADLVVVVEGRDQEAEQARVERLGGRVSRLNDERAKNTNQQKISLNSAEGEHQATQMEMQNPDIGVYRAGVYWTIWADDLATLKSQVDEAKAAIRGVKCRVGRGWGAQYPLWLATRGLGYAPTVGMHRDLSPALSTLFPVFTDQPTRHRRGVILGETSLGREQVNIDVDAPDMPAQQIGALGLPNSGKSTFFNWLALNYYLEARSPKEGNGVLIYDSSGSYFYANQTFGGTYARPLNKEVERPPSLGAWEIIHRANRNHEGRVGDMLRLHEAMYGRGHDHERLTSWQFGTLGELIDQVYATARDPQDSPYPLEGELLAKIEKLTVPTNRRLEKEDLLMGLSNYGPRGPWRSLAAQERDVDLEHRYLVMDTRDCGGKQGLVTYRIFEALGLWRASLRAGQRRADGQPAKEVLVMDEGYKYLSEWREMTEAGTLRSRHLNRLFLFGTQFASAMCRTAEGAQMLSAWPLIAVFRLRDERVGSDGGNAWLGPTLGVTPGEVDQFPQMAMISGVAAQGLLIARTMGAGTQDSFRSLVDFGYPRAALEMFKTQPAERSEAAAVLAAHAGVEGLTRLQSGDPAYWEAAKEMAARAEAARRGRG